MKGFNEYLYYAWIVEQINEEVKNGGMNRCIDEWESEWTSQFLDKWMDG